MRSQVEHAPTTFWGLCSFFPTCALGEFLSSCLLNDHLAPVSPVFAFQCPPVATLCVRVSTEERASVCVSAIWSHTKGHCLPGRTMALAPTTVATCHGVAVHWGRKQHPESRSSCLLPSHAPSFSSPSCPPGSTGTMNVRSHILLHLVTELGSSRTSATGPSWTWVPNNVLFP